MTALCSPPGKKGRAREEGDEEAEDGLEERREAEVEAEAGGRDQPLLLPDTAAVVAVAFFACTRARSDGSELGEMASLLDMASMGLRPAATEAECMAGATIAAGATVATSIAASEQRRETKC